MLSSSMSSDPSSRLSPGPQNPSLQKTRRAGLSGGGFWRLAALLLVLTVVLAVVLAVSSPSEQAVIGKIGRIAGMGIAAICCVSMSRRLVPGRERLAWNLVALAVVGYVIAELIILLLSLSSLGAPIPAVAAVLSAPFYVLGATGVLLFPAVQTTGLKLVYVVLEVCIVVGALLGLGFVFVLVPRLAEGLSIDYGVIVIPVVDAAAGLAFIVLLARGVQPSYRPVFFWLICTAICFLYGDSAASYLALPGLSSSSSRLPFSDAVWTAGALAIALAPLSLLVRGGASGSAWGWLDRLFTRFKLPERLQWAGQLVLLASPAAVLFALIIYAIARPEPGAALPLAIIALVVVLLIIVRQVFTVRDLIHSQVAVARAQQLEALKDQFITSVNHELRTPMMTMQGYIELLSDLQEQVDPRKRAQMLDRARRANAALVHLLQSILDVRRIDQEAGDFVPQVVNVYTTAQTALTLIDPREGNIAERRLIMHIPEDLAIWGEAVRLQQMLTNLITNAIKYSAPGTTIRVAAQVVAEKAPRLRSWGKSDIQRRQMVEITVQDEGLGIPPEQIPLLFHRFVRLPRDMSSRVHGNGLGLYLCRVFAEALGGTVWVESTGVPGEGSTFHLRLPAPPVGPVRSLAEQLAYG